MGEFQPLIDKLADSELDELTADNVGENNLRDVVDLLKEVRAELVSADSLDSHEIPQIVRNEFFGGNFGNEVDGLLTAMRSYGPSTANMAQERQTFFTRAQGLRDKTLTHLRPYLRFDEAAVRRRLTDLEALEAKMTSLLEEGGKQQSALAKSSASVAASDLSTFYETQSTSHRDSAKNFLIGGGVSGAIFVALTLWFFFKSPPDYTATASTEQWIEVIRATAARLVLLSMAGFLIAFCARNYRVNMHLEVLNKRRENALNTFGLMQASVTSEDARNIVVGELVRSVFTSEDTGYLTGETERTIIESPGGGAGLLSAVSAMSRQRDG